VSEQWKLFRLLAAILHLGNVSIHRPKRDDTAEIDTSSDDLPIATAAELLQVQRDQLAKWIVKRNIQTKAETIVTGRTVDEATAARDSISKFMYARLFDWLVGKVNVSLDRSKSNSRFIGLLDIYGFEIFKHNRWLRRARPRARQAARGGGGKADGRLTGGAHACAHTCAASSSSASTTRTRSCSRSLCSTCSNWSRSCTRARRSSGRSSTTPTTSPAST
jgi:hypothetical protein